MMNEEQQKLQWGYDPIVTCDGCGAEIRLSTVEIVYNHEIDMEFFFCPLCVELAKE